MLEFIFSFLLNYAPALSVFIFSIIILIVINIFYKILVNQNDARLIKQRTKDIGKQMKDAQKAGNTEHSKKLMGEMLSENNKMMKMTMKPMIVSMIVVILLLPSLGTFYGDKTVANGGSLMLDGSNRTVSNNAGSISIDGIACNPACKIGRYNYKVTNEGKDVKVAMVTTVLPISIPILGNMFGWLGWYIICSMPLVIIIRKSMKIYM